MLDWQAYIEVADKFQTKARFEDRPDLRQDIIVRLAEVATNGNKPLTQASMVRVASYVAMEYWRDLKRQPSLLSLNEEVTDTEGDSIELYQTLADDKAIDLDAWLDAKTWLKGCPRRLVKVATKRARGKPLTETERRYFNRSRQKELDKRQLPLF